VQLPPGRGRFQGKAQPQLSEAQAFAKVYGAAKRRALRASDGGNSARASPSLYLTPPSHLVTSFCGGSQNDDRLSAAADTNASIPKKF
jgi:hypothetical protein